MKRAAKISDFLEDLLAGQGLSAIAQTVRLRACWPEIVGSLLSDKTSPARLKNGILSVIVLNHAWAQELQMKKPVLMGQANRVLGTDSVKDIRFSVGPLPAGEELDQAQPRFEEPLSAIPDPEGIASISDPETRRILRSIARRMASLKR